MVAILDFTRKFTFGYGALEIRLLRSLYIMFALSWLLNINAPVYLGINSMNVIYQPKSFFNKSNFPS